MYLFYSTEAQTSGTSSWNTDKWPSGINSSAGLFETMSEHPTQIQLKTKNNKIPSWIQGSFYRNGPAIYEWGKTAYKHMFDPNGILQRFEIGNGKVWYNSRYIRSRNYFGNRDADKIIFPEVGTYAEFDNVTHDEHGHKIRNPITVKKNRMNFNMKYGTSPNTVVTVMPFHGWMLSLTEGLVGHLHDPVSLEIVHELDFKTSLNIPKGFNIQLLSAHGVIDVNDGSWWNSGVGIDQSTRVPGGTSGHFVIKSKNAVDFNNVFGNKKTPDQILASIEWSQVLPNDDVLDKNIRYFHMFGATDKYIVLPLLSVSINPATMLKLMSNAKPMIGAFEYKDVETVYHFFDKQQFKFIAKKFTAPPSFFAHLVNTFDAENGDVVLDTCLGSNGHVFNLYTFENINSTGATLEQVFESFSPVGTPVTYKFPLSATSNLDADEPVDVKPVKMFKPETSGNWSCFEKGGFEFPVVDFSSKFGKDYDHFWGAGFGSVMPDRLYHVQKSNKKRWIFLDEHYSPSEPMFVKSPKAKHGADGVLLSIMTPRNRPDLR